MAGVENSGLPFTPPVMAEPLTDADYAMLARSGISRECADRACLFRVDDAHGALLVGRGPGNHAGIVYPYFRPAERAPSEYQLRVDLPELKYDKNGKPKEGMKYIWPPRPTRAYYPPPSRAEWFTDPSIPIIITEGPKKSLALAVLAWHELPDVQTDPRFAVMGFPGVWCFRGKAGRGDGPNGDRRDVHAVIPDVVATKWTGREALIVYDANALTNKDVAKARAALAKELHNRGAKVFLVDLPQVEGVNGVDDLIGQWGPDRVLTMLAESKRAAGPGMGLTRQLAEEILKSDHFAQDAGRRLFVYSRGVYCPKGEEQVRRRVKQLLVSSDQDRRWFVRQGEEVVEFIRVDSPELWTRPPLDTLNVRNCLIDLTSGPRYQTRDHSPEHLSPVQLPVDYDSSATCPAWDEFVKQTFPADSQDVAFEIVAWLMTPHTAIQKAVLLTGEGSNGKSTYLTALSAFLGKANVTAVSLHRLEADRFAVARLHGKLANVCPDLPSEHLQSTSVFKQLTGGDALLAEHKYKDSFELVPFARLVFSANHPPRSADASQAFFRRWLVVPFDRTFEGAAAIPRDKLDARLAEPKELSGVLNKALALLGRVRTSGITEAATMQQAHGDFRQATEPLAVWLDRHTVDTGEVPQKLLRIAYNRFTEGAGLPPMNPQNFGRAIKRLRPNVGEGQRGSNKEWFYTGIGLKTAANESEGV
jgi:putative DNA primase/helicase